MRRFIWIVAVFSLMIFACEREQPPAPEVTRQPDAAPPATAPPAATPEAAAGAGQYQIDRAVGEAIYQQTCATCHEQGIAGAPRQGDRADWQPRIAQGMDVLIRHSIEGFQGNQGVMPPKGGNPALSDDEVASAVAYMVELNQ